MEDVGGLTASRVLAMGGGDIVEMTVVRLISKSRASLV